MNIQESLENFSKLGRKELLERAENFIFSTGLNDGASQLCRKNMKYGLAQFHYIQYNHGLMPNAVFISTPDETISRNNYRWNSGIGYGGRINWGPGDDKFIFLNIKPNCCGLLVGGLYEKPDPQKIIERIEEIETHELYINDIKLEWDYYVGNHFIDLYETKNLSDIDFPPYMFIIHGAVSEFRTDKYGIGLYIDKSNTLREMATQIETPFGKQFIIQGNNAKEYLDFHDYALNFAAEKRELVGTKLFDEYEVISNKSHQFLADYNNSYLGCHSTDLSKKNGNDQSNLFPICLRADMPAYIFEGKANFSYTVLKNRGFLGTAEKYDLLNILLNANVLPHGGGYAFPDVENVEQVIEFEDKRYFLCNLKSKIKTRKIFKSPSEMEFMYRGRNVILKTLQLDLGVVVARLVPDYVLKI
jgi:hypothetical protein